MDAMLMGQTYGIGITALMMTAWIQHTKKRPVQPPGHTWYEQQRMNKPRMRTGGGKPGNRKNKARQ